MIQAFFSRNFEYLPVTWTLDKSEDLQTNDLEAVQRKRCGPTLADHRGSKCTGVECWLVMWRSLRARVWRIVLSMFLCKLYQAKILVSILYNCRVYLKVSVGMNMYTNRFIMIYIHTHISSYFFICTHVTDSLNRQFEHDSLHFWQRFFQSQSRILPSCEWKMALWYLSRRRNGYDFWIWFLGIKGIFSCDKAGFLGVYCGTWKVFLER